MKLSNATDPPSPLALVIAFIAAAILLLYCFLNHASAHDIGNPELEANYTFQTCCAVDDCIAQRVINTDAANGQPEWPMMNLLIEWMPTKVNATKFRWLDEAHHTYVCYIAHGNGVYIITDDNIRCIIFPKREQYN